LQVDIVARLVNSLDWELIKAEGLRATRERRGNPDAADPRHASRGQMGFA
jgi:hypothetical protein